MKHYAYTLIVLLLTANVIWQTLPLHAQPNESPRTEAIIGGTIAPATLFPAVAVVYIDAGICTGTLVDPSHVLTAGHCAFDDRGRLVKEMAEISVIFGSEVRGARSLHVHPLYNNHAAACTEGSPDASLIELDSPIYTITPVPVSEVPPAVGTQLLLVGYGMLGTGQNGQNGLFPANDFLAYGYTTVDHVSPTFVQWKYKSSRGGANTAGGDSGGPAFQTVNGQLVLSAITCGGTGNAQYGTESLDTRGDILIDWLSQYVSGISSTAPPTIAEPGIIQARAQRSVNYPINISGAKPVSLVVQGLPAGLELRNGAIQGVAQTPGSWPITLVAANDFGTRTVSSTLLVRPPDTLFKITRSTLQFNRSIFSKDLLLIRGQITAQRSRLAKNRSLTLQFGSYRRSFVLGVTRRISSNAGDILSVNSVKSAPASTRSTIDFKITIRNSLAFTGLESLGFSSTGIAAFGQRFILPVTFEFDGNQAITQQVLSLQSTDLRWHLIP